MNLISIVVLYTMGLEIRERGRVDATVRKSLLQNLKTLQEVPPARWYANILRQNQYMQRMPRSPLEI